MNPQEEALALAKKAGGLMPQAQGDECVSIVIEGRRCTFDVYDEAQYNEFIESCATFGSGGL